MRACGQPVRSVAGDVTRCIERGREIRGKVSSG